MPQHDSLRWINDQSAAGDWNMSADQALLESVEQTGTPVLRFYYWTPATLSLGYFQSANDRTFHSESLTCPMVRRASGGGAILHDREVTYSICFPSASRWASRNTEIYRLLHDGITATLHEWSIEAVAFREKGESKPKTPEFLCFQRCGDGDLLLDGCKIVGSAQRRSRRAVLQHGSILLAQSGFAPQLPGIQDISGRTVEPREFVPLLSAAIADRLGLQLLESELTRAEKELAEQIMTIRFANDAWNLERKKVPQSNCRQDQQK